MKLRELFRQQKADRNDRGFNMLELIMVVVVIGILGGIGFAIYQGVSGEARGTVLDSNITTAAEQMQAVLAVDPTLAGEGRVAELAAEMTNRTNFVWFGDDGSGGSEWVFGDDDDAAVVRFQWLDAAQPPVEPDGSTTATTTPAVNWIVDGSSAVRLHLQNQEDQWRCALVILKPSISKLRGKNDYNTLAGATAISEPHAKLVSAELSGLWFDGGSTAASTTYDHDHDCSPVADVTGATLTKAAGRGCATGGTSTLTSATLDICLPTDANTWAIYATSGKVDPASTATTDLRTLHGEIGQLDSNA